ncbi:MAG: rane protein [Moraxellaceae bacterium]|nr:rane protein [Moraxellaceae bacterium]
MPALPNSTPARIALALAALLALGLVLRAARGPELPGYVVEARPLVQRVVASGQVSSQSLARVGSEITGVVQARHVREGDAVRPGQLLLELQADEQQARVREAEAALRQLATSRRPQAEAQVKEAESNLAKAAGERARREELFARGLLSAEQREQARNAEVAARAGRDQARLQLGALGSGGAEEQVLRQRLEQARAALAKTKIHARVAGIVQTRDVEPGDLVQPGRTLLEIARADSREIVVALDEKSLAPLALGQGAQVVADAFPERVLPARVSFIAPSVDAARGTADVHLELAAPADFLRQGMTVSVNIETARADRALVLPNDALRTLQGDRASVLRVQGGKVESVPVRLGLRSTTLSEIREGLKAGDAVLAVEAAPGSRARVLPQALPAVEAATQVDPSALPLPGGS